MVGRGRDAACSCFSVWRMITRGSGRRSEGAGRIALRILRELLPVIHELLLFVLLGGAGREQTEQGQEAKDGNGPLSHSILHSPQGRGEAVR